MIEASDNAPIVALLGTGTMGLGMGLNIARAGLSLRAWNRTPAKAEPLAAEGAVVAASAAEAVEGADVVVTMLFDADSVASAIGAAAGSLKPGTTWIQTSTVGVEGHDRLAALAREHGLVLVDAPVLGTKGPAEQGALTVLASGPDSARPVVTPVFEAIGSRTMWVGEAGAGTRLKLVANGWVLTVLDGVAQSLKTAEAFGLDPALFLEAVKGSAVDAAYVGLKGRAMLNDSYEPSFALSGAVKDAGLIVDGARAAGADPAFVAVALEHLARAERAGHGDKDMGAVYLGY
ncbi:NAD(P)-dependent oxidoreductase [Kineosporia succinea]|uniref:3-hydroxyisobutyrate dehydrogenase n=1 Tax=Kineosporia succinea TaxID=84632 RepID=A0ABT9P3H7_9ACTN|nr:NAD(P)-dependent oxidoreductase [Kineosporia succinea]MDP9827027.1 3-hydroxyisobutyrate dehydrogenase [Kineosporia succinea]